MGSLACTVRPPLLARVTHPDMYLVARKGGKPKRWSRPRAAWVVRRPPSQGWRVGQKPSFQQGVAGNVAGIPCVIKASENAALVPCHSAN